MYYRQPSSPTSNTSFSWVHNSSFESPSGSGSHFGHAVVLNDQLISFGAYGDGTDYCIIHLSTPLHLYIPLSHLDSLRGALYLYERLAKYDISITFGKGGSTSSVETHVTAPYSVQFPWMVVIIIVAATMFCCGSLGMIVYCCCCIEPVVPLSKKKKSKKKGGEEQSPYTIHSYRGYVDSDDEDAFTVDRNGKVVKKHDPKASRKGSYKVYGPGGFEGEVDPSLSSSDELDEKKVGTVMDDSDSASATSDSESSMDEYATVVKSIHSMRSSLTAGSSYYSNDSSMSYVEQAKAKHRQIKDYGGGSASIVSGDGTSSFVEQGRAKLLLYKKNSGESMRSVSMESDDASNVFSVEQQADENLDLYKKDGDESVTADSIESDRTSNFSLVEHARTSLQLYKKDADDDESVSASSSMSDTKSNPLIEQAKAKLQFYKKQSVESISESDTVSRSSSSFVEQAKARLKTYQRGSATQVGSSTSSLNEEDSMFEETSLKSNYTYVSEAKAKYAEVRRASTISLESEREALVTKARARYQALRTISSSGSSMADTEPCDEATTVVTESEETETVKSEIDPSVG